MTALGVVVLCRALPSRAAYAELRDGRVLKFYTGTRATQSHLSRLVEGGHGAHYGLATPVENAVHYFTFEMEEMMDSFDCAMEEMSDSVSPRQPSDWVRLVGHLPEWMDDPTNR